MIHYSFDTNLYWNLFELIVIKGIDYITIYKVFNRNLSILSIYNRDMLISLQY